MQSTSLRSRQNLAAMQLTVEALEDRSLPSGLSYLIVGEDESGLPAHFNNRIQVAGGVVRFTIPQIGIALVDSDDRQFDNRAEHIPGVRSVLFMGVARPELPAVPPPVLPPQPHFGPHVQVTRDEMSSLQWDLGAIDADGAWAQGASGEGVRVAILDSGFRGDHPDLRFNRHLSKSVTLGPPGDTWVTPSAPFLGWHGTYVTGVMAALDNGIGTVGVNPRSDFVAIKAFEDGTSYFDGVDLATTLRGIVYAADIHADVLNMSFSFQYDKAGFVYDPFNTPNDPSDDVVETKHDTAEIGRAFRRATDYAHDKGVTMVAGSGNEAFDFDTKDDLYYWPQSLPHVITVSATAPHGFANDSNADPDVPADYTNIGKSYVDIAAPGGNLDADLLVSDQLVTVFGVTAPAWALDAVFTTGGVEFPDIYPDFQQAWVTGTSFAGPHVAGVVALVIEANGGRMDPDDVFRILKRSADDLGEPGKDAFYGHGRVNASKAVALALEESHHGHQMFGHETSSGRTGFPTLTNPNFGGLTMPALFTRIEQHGRRTITPLAAFDPGPSTSRLVAPHPDVSVGRQATSWRWAEEALDLLDISPIDLRS